MTLCKDCQNMFLADIEVDGVNHTVVSCYKNNDLFNQCWRIEEELGRKCQILLKDDVKIPIVKKCSQFVSIQED